MYVYVWRVCTVRYGTCSTTARHCAHAHRHLRRTFSLCFLLLLYLGTASITSRFYNGRKFLLWFTCRRTDTHFPLHFAVSYPSSGLPHTQVEVEVELEDLSLSLSLWGTPIRLLKNNRKRELQVLVI